MKFDIKQKPVWDGTEDDPSGFYEAYIDHLNSIVKAQGELLDRYKNSGAAKDPVLFRTVVSIDEDYNALQQAIKEAKS